MQKIIQTLWLVLLLLSTAVFLPHPTIAQNEVAVVDQSWDGEFRDHLTFEISAESSAQIEEVELFYRIIGQLATSRNNADFTPGQAVEAEFVIDQTQPANYMPPGTEIEYWWQLTDAAGNELRTDKQTITFLDNRYTWNTLDNERLTLYWYQGEQSFGQALFERANLALDTLKTDIGIELENPIKIFIYGSHQDLLRAISTSAQEWTGGQAFTEHGVVVIGVRPDQLTWGLDAMTHEMSHLVIHQATDNPFGGLPRWLDEGIAVYNENQNELDDDFRLTFERAVANDELMTLRTLSSPFPADPMAANLAYGQSGAVVRFIVDTYGSEAMANLLDIFSEGALYDEALEEALGTDTDGLDNAFRTSLDLPPLPNSAETTAGHSEEAVAPAENAAAEAVAPAEEAAPAQPEQAAVAETESSASEASSEAASSPLGLLSCVTGLLALLFLGGITYGRG